MHEELIRKAIDLKLGIADKILNRLPAEASGKIRELGRVVCESVGEHLKDADKDTNKPSSGNINSVRID